MLNLLLAVATVLFMQAPITVPDTPAGRGLEEFVASFNAGGADRSAWLTGRTTLSADEAADILQQDAAILGEHGAFSIVRIPSSTATSITAILRHARSGVHAHLLIEAAADAPHKITNMQLRPATQAEIDGK